MKDRFRERIRVAEQKIILQYKIFLVRGYLFQTMEDDISPKQ